jgi:hypothetical protein
MADDHHDRSAIRAITEAALPHGLTRTQIAKEAGNLQSSTAFKKKFKMYEGNSLRPPVLIVKNRRYAPAGRALLRGVWPSTMYNDHAL